MSRLYACLVFTLFACVPLAAQVTVEECVASARENYPLIRKYDLLHRMKEVNLSEINKSWLPQISVYGQGSVQNETPSFPESLSGALSQAGTPISGLNEWQYKVGADVSQTLWDGGATRTRRRIEEAEDAEWHAALEVQLYVVRERVEKLFFGILLIEEQVKQSQTMLTLLQSNLDKLRSMRKHGTALQSDVDMVEAEYLTTVQQLVQAESTSRSYREMLEILTGKSVKGQTLVKPDGALPLDLVVERPELRYFDMQLRTREAREESITTNTMPKVGLFAQVYYGYPGFDYFESMMTHDPSFNVLAGVKVSWSIGAFYTKRNKRQQLRISAKDVSVERDVFLFNSRLEVQSQLEHIRALKDIMKENDRIVELRTNVRKAAESQLDNGVIDATALLTKLTDERQARLTAAYHEIQLLQSIYQLKYTLNQ